MKYRFSNNGFSLIEILVYIALLGMTSIFITNSLIQIANAYNRARAEREVISNGRLILETINKSVEQAQEVYGPTSGFNNDSGQLSLATVVGADAEHTTIFADYYLDNGRIFLRQEGQSALPISAATVRVSKFRLERIIQGLNREAVKITLQVDFVPPKYASSITLNSTTALRGSY